MIAEFQSRILRPHPFTLGMRQHVALRSSQSVSKRMAKLVTLILFVSLLVVFVFSQVVHWQINTLSGKLESMKTARIVNSSKNIELLATRAQLASQKYIEEKAREQLQLLTPKRNQIRRL